jgi:CheY-like chemotaxis protein
MEKIEINIEDTVINILLADDDREGHSFFCKAMETTIFNIQLININDGERLMSYLHKNSQQLPDVLFLHHDLPCDNVLNCLSEIKLHNKLKELPVIIYSTTLRKDVLDVLYNAGAHYYINIMDHLTFKKVVEGIFTQIREKKFFRPSRTEFILSY